MNPATIPWALCAGIAGATFVYAIGRPWRRLGPRVNAYTVPVRTRLGAPRAEMLALVEPRGDASAVAVVLGPMVTAASTRLSRLFGHRDEAALALALDRAGVRGVSPGAYGRQQLLYGILGLAGGFALGLTRGGRQAVVMAVVFGFFGATWKRNELTRRTEKRTARIRAELVPVCQMLSVFSRALPNLQDSVLAVCREGRGEVVGELRRILYLISSGSDPAAAFRRLGDLTPEPAASRLYHRLALALESGGDITGALLAQATDLNHQFRDERKARATRRLQGMIVINSTFMILPLFILMAAAFPSMVTGAL